MELKMRVSGIDVVVKRLDDVAGFDPAPICARVAQEQALRLSDATPVRTGRAKAGWRTEPIADGASIVNDVFYVPFLLEGTGRRRVVVVNPAWPGMSPNAALRAVWLSAPDDITTAVEHGIHGALAALVP